jgi:mxaJ protein
MSSACHRALACLLAAFAAGAGARELRVCADPDALPFSHRDGSGFENRNRAHRRRRDGGGAAL